MLPAGACPVVLDWSLGLRHRWSYSVRVFAVDFLAGRRLSLCSVSLWLFFSSSILNPHSSLCSVVAFSVLVSPSLSSTFVFSYGILLLCGCPLLYGEGPGPESPGPIPKEARCVRTSVVLPLFPSSPVRTQSRAAGLRATRQGLVHRQVHRFGTAGEAVVAHRANGPFLCSTGPNRVNRGEAGAGLDGVLRVATGCSRPAPPARRSSARAGAGGQSPRPSRGQRPCSRG